MLFNTINLYQRQLQFDFFFLILLFKSVMILQLSVKHVQLEVARPTKMATKKLQDLPISLIDGNKLQDLPRLPRDRYGNGIGLPGGIR